MCIRDSYETTRTDEKDRAYSVSIDGGVSFTAKRAFRVSSSTCEAIIKVGQTGWTVLTPVSYTHLPCWIPTLTISDV